MTSTLKGDVSAHSHEAQKSGHHQASDLGSANFGTRVLNHCTIWPKQMIGKSCHECRVIHTPLGIRLCVLYHNPGLPASQLSINLWGPSSSRSGPITFPITALVSPHPRCPSICGDQAPPGQDLELSPSQPWSHHIPGVHQFVGTKLLQVTDCADSLLLCQHPGGVLAPGRCSING